MRWSAFKVLRFQTPPDKRRKAQMEIVFGYLEVASNFVTVAAALIQIYIFLEKRL